MTDSNNRRSIIKYLYLIVILGAGIFLAVIAIDPRAGRLWKRYENAIILQHLFDKEIGDARIHLVGKVTDMNNRELEDVTLDLDFSRPKNFGLESEDLRETRKINGSFTIEKSRYTSISISFDKDGYRTEHITFYTSEAANTPKSAIQENCHIKGHDVLSWKQGRQSCPRRHCNHKQGN